MKDEKNWYPIGKEEEPEDEMKIFQSIRTEIVIDEESERRFD